MLLRLVRSRTVFNEIRRYLFQDLSRDMSRLRGSAIDLFARRQNEKSNKIDLSNLNNAELIVVGEDNLGFQPSLIVNFGKQSYLFNVPEGFQRYCNSNQIRINRLENIFVTNFDWERVSGLYGLSLTLQGCGATAVTLHTCEHGKDFFPAADTFLKYFTGIKCSTRVFSQGDIEDQYLHVQPIPIEKCSKLVDPEASPDNPDFEPSNKATRISPRVLSFLCTLPDLNGPLIPDKCRELNVPIGPHLAQLKLGENVTLKDGRTIRSVDVCGPKKLGSKFLVIDCPNFTYLDAFLNNSALLEAKELHKHSKDRMIELVIHFTPNEIVKSTQYQKWMGGFSEHCKHLILSNDHLTRVNFISAYRINHLLRRIDQEIFPELTLPPSLKTKADKEINADEAPLSEDREFAYIKQIDFESAERYINTGSLNRFTLRPHKNIESIEPVLNINSDLKDAESLENFDLLLNQYKEQVKKLPKAEPWEPEVVFLGTGSANPSKYRNVSAVLVNFQSPHNASILLDCGEDTLGQMIRLYGAHTDEVLRKIKLIYISHQHADHHIGLIRLLRRRLKLTDEMIHVLMPPGLESLIDYHNQNFDVDLSKAIHIYNTKFMVTIPTKPLLRTGGPKELRNMLCKRLSGLLNDIVIVPVEHCVNSSAVVMKFNLHPGQSPFILAYSGDARPSSDFVLAGKNCDLLIHEATFDHRGLTDAIEKKHSTTKEAIQVGRDMYAKFNILTHFSTKFAKVPYFTEDFDDKVGFAFDFLSLRCPSQLPRLPMMKPIVSSLFAESLLAIDISHEKRILKQEIIKRNIKMST